MRRGTRRPLVVHVVGARPNYMKVAPVYAELERRKSVEQRLIHTGQHYDAAVKDVFFAELPLPQPHVQLEVGSGAHGEQTARALAGLERVFQELEPDLVVVPGDVNSTLAGALAAVKLQIPVCHLEAGLRSFDRTMPEEHNRRVTDHLSTLLLTHSREAHDNLEQEGISGECVVLVGNTMIDTLMANVGKARRLAVWRQLGLRAGGYVLVTLHRPALVDEPELLTRTMRALEAVAVESPVVFPVHPRTLDRLETLGFAPSERLVLTKPLPYKRFLSLQAGAEAVVTDSGGVQEETTALGVPCFTLRDNTDRPVTVTQGSNTVLGLDPDRLAEIPALIAERLTELRKPPFWDGHASERAADAIERLVAGPAAEPLAAAGLAPRAVPVRVPSPLPAQPTA
jgi:UDP-N-acetylglucosamine 2-epimerase (non-hydrolysing)